MSKPRFVISCPYDTYSGYGARSRDLVKAIIELDKYKVELLPQRWGDTSWGFCMDHPEWNFLYKHQAKQDWQKSQPEIWMQITIPNEFQPVGKYNIGCTAGIESTACKAEWIQGLNRMDTNWVSSHFAKSTFDKMVYDRKDQNTGQVLEQIKLNKPVEVVFEGANLDLYHPMPASQIKNISLKDIKEQFCYLFVGHWMNGEFGHDRKNVGVLVESFYEAFKNKRGSKPALILKASSGVSSYISRDTILDKIKAIRDKVGGSNLPNIYLLSGEFNDYEMNELYNHPKVKAMVSFTKGEGYGRPLLEFSLVGKPIIASGWSGHLDFLDKNSVVLLGGHLENIHDSVVNDWLIKEAQWFQVNKQQGISALKQVYKKYKQYAKNGTKQRFFASSNYSFENMKQLVGKKLVDNVPDFPKQVELELPKLELPKLNKV